MFLCGLMKTYTVKTTDDLVQTIQADYMEKDATTYSFVARGITIAYFPIPQVVYAIEGTPQSA
jgi:hypothetical protein